MQDLTDPHVIKHDFSSSSRTHYTDAGSSSSFSIFHSAPKKEHLAIMFVMVEVRNMQFWTLPWDHKYQTSLILMIHDREARSGSSTVENE